MEERQAESHPVNRQTQEHEHNPHDKRNKLSDMATHPDRPELRRMPEEVKEDRWYRLVVVDSPDRLIREPSVPLEVLETLFPFLLMERGDEKAPSEGASLEEQDH